jgi:hypothetical protein
MKKMINKWLFLSLLDFHGFQEPVKSFGSYFLKIYFEKKSNFIIILLLNFSNSVKSGQYAPHFLNFVG